jgi:predicted DNA-binding transcriptional regulator AlpA
MSASELLGEALITIKELAEFLRFSTRSVWRKCSAGEIPQPVYVGPKTPRWRSEVIKNWINQKV